MHTWARRGLQTALVTGGLLMLGTGIASADEDVSPDSPAGPLDVDVTIPVDIDDNAIGTPAGQVNLPGYHGEISTKPVTKPMKKAAEPVTKAAKPASDAAKPATDAIGGAAGQVAGAASKAGQTAGQAAEKASGEASGKAAENSGDKRTGKADQRANERQVAAPTAPSLEPSADPAKGNKVDLDLTAPIQITGNAVGIIGDAEVEDSQSNQSYANNDDTKTSGKNSGLAGNVVGLDWALPVQIAGNAGGLLGGSGHTSGTASQDVSQTGDITTDGKGSGLAGNVVAAQFATPVQATGNAASWIFGNAYSEHDATSEAESGGAIDTHGKGGAGSGNVGAGPLALPLKFNGNAASAWASDADATANSEANATAGGTKTGLNDIPSYVQTDGDDSFAAGNIVQPQGAGVGNVAGLAASWIGNAATGNALGDESARAAAGPGSSASEATAGGFSSSSAEDSAGSGNIVDAPLAFPAELFGIGAAYIGNSHAAHDNSTDVEAGDGTFTNGNGSFLSANTVAGQLASTLEGFGIGGAHIGNASGTASENKEVESGGYNGTLGNDSAGSGNLVQAPLAIPGEIFGVGGSFIGMGKGEAEETKEVEAGGGGNTEDDGAFGSSNLVAAPLSVPAQLFGIGGSFIGKGDGAAVADTTTQAGDEYKASGVAGAIAGNLVHAPVALPVQGHGVGGALFGIGNGLSDNLTDSTAGGDATTDGSGGGIAGNIVQAPIAGAANVFGDGLAAAGLGKGSGLNDVVSTAGGDAETNGDGGAIAGNVLGAQGLPIAQVFGDAASLLGVADGAGVNTTESTSGGDIETSGVEGALSGDILDVPAAAVAQIFGDGVSLGGVAHGLGDNVTTGTVGGTDTTEGTLNSGSGFNGQLPIGALAQVYNVPAGLLATATAEASNLTDVSVAGHEPQINLPIDGSELPANDLPTLPAPQVPSVPAAPALPTAQQGAQRADVQQPDVPGLSDLSALEVPDLPAPELPAVDEVLADPTGLVSQADAPSVAQVQNTPLDSLQRSLAEAAGKGVHIQG